MPRTRSNAATTPLLSCRFVASVRRAYLYTTPNRKVEAPAPPKAHNAWLGQGSRQSASKPADGPCSPCFPSFQAFSFQSFAAVASADCRIEEAFSASSSAALRRSAAALDGADSSARFSARACCCSSEPWRLEDGACQACLFRVSYAWTEDSS